tara:strand:+ start:49 stop:831 length:783 start_codon:yes stop_codon:yes gene_type:complete
MSLIDSTLFPVEEVPIFKDVVTHYLGTHDKNGRSGYKFIVRKDTRQILSVMTDDYKLVTNKQIIDAAVPTLKKFGAEVREAVSLANGQRTVYKWIMPKEFIKIDSKDVMNPEIIIKNSYDGSLQIHILAGAFRLVCSNGMIIGKTISNHNYKHNVGNTRLDNLEEVISKVIAKTKAEGSKLPKLKDTKLNELHIIDLIKLFPSTMSEFLTQYLIANKPKTYWDLYNVATYILTHRMSRRYTTTHKLEAQIYPSIIKWAKA